MSLELDICQSSFSSVSRDKSEDETSEEDDNENVEALDGIGNSDSVVAEVTDDRIIDGKSDSKQNDDKDDDMQGVTKEQNSV